MSKASNTQDYSTTLDSVPVMVECMGMKTPDGLDIVFIRMMGALRKDGTRKQLKKSRPGVIMPNGDLKARGPWRAA